MPAEFDDGLIGIEPGDEVRIEFEIPDTSSNEEFVGKTARLRASTVHEIKAKVLPEVDDEFAAVGGRLRHRRRRCARTCAIRLARQTQDAAARAREGEALKAQLAERLEGEVPESMIDSRRPAS